MSMVSSFKIYVHLKTIELKHQLAIDAKKITLTENVAFECTRLSAFS